MLSGCKKELPENSSKLDSITHILTFFFFKMSVGCINLNNTSGPLYIRRIRSVRVSSTKQSSLVWDKGGARTSYIMENSRIRCYRVQHNSYTCEFLYFLVLRLPVRQVLRCRPKQALHTYADELQAMDSKVQKPPHITSFSFPPSPGPHLCCFLLSPSIPQPEASEATLNPNYSFWLTLSRDL